MNNYNHYINFADLLRYPGEGYPEKAVECLNMLKEKYPEVVEQIKPFVDYMTSRTQDDREELFTKTFDVQPICYLDLGYVIFGEDYKRGAFLLHMQDEQLKAGNDCGTDLSDNICNMLTLYTKSKDQSFLEELAVKIFIPGVEKMIAEFKQARIDLKIKILKKMQRAIIQEELNTGNVYCNLLTALLLVLQKDFANISFKPVLDPVIDIQHHNSFFGKNSINTEVNKFAEAQNIAALHKLD